MGLEAGLVGRRQAERRIETHKAIDRRPKAIDASPGGVAIACRSGGAPGASANHFPSRSWAAGTSNDSPMRAPVPPRQRNSYRDCARSVGSRAAAESGASGRGRRGTADVRRRVLRPAACRSRRVAPRRARLRSGGEGVCMPMRPDRAPARSVDSTPGPLPSCRGRTPAAGPTAGRDETAHCRTRTWHRNREDRASRPGRRLPFVSPDWARAGP